MIRLIQHRILKSQGKDTLNTDGWESGLSAGRIRNALDSWQADALPGGFLRLTEAGGDLKLILDAFGTDGDLRLPPEKELRRLKYTLDRTGLV